MGFSLSWAAVRGAAPQTVHDALGLRVTGAREEFPESDITGVGLSTGWYAVISQRDKLEFTKGKTLQRLSEFGEVIMCFVEEHVMCSVAARWQDGEQVWSIYHDAGSGIESLKVEGSPPPEFTSIRDRISSEQTAAGGKNAEVDYIFDIPVELAKSLTGYRHDEDIPDLPKNAFEVMVSTDQKSQHGSFWKKLFGKRE